MITETSVRGNRQNGYILLDILVMILLLAISFGSIAAALKGSVDTIGRQETLIGETIGELNKKAVSFELPIEQLQ